MCCVENSIQDICDVLLGNFKIMLVIPNCLTVIALTMLTKHFGHNLNPHDNLPIQNYYEKMEKRQERETDSSKKEHTTKLITPQVAKIEHTYRPGKCQQNIICSTWQTTGDNTGALD